MKKANLNRLECMSGEDCPRFFIGAHHLLFVAACKKVPLVQSPELLSTLSCSRFVHEGGEVLNCHFVNGKTFYSA